MVNVERYSFRKIIGVDFIVTNGSITKQIEKLKDDDDRIAQEAFHDIYQRCFDWLVGVARNVLDGYPRGAADEEDAVQSGLMAFFCGVREDRFPKLNNRKNLWSLLVTIIERKAINQRNQQRAKKRGEGRVRGDSAFGYGSDHVGAQPAAPDPSPVTTAEIREKMDYLFSLLDDETVRQVALMKLEGYRNRDIAKKLGVVERTIERKLNYVRSRWSELLNERESQQE